MLRKGAGIAKVTGMRPKTQTLTHLLELFLSLNGNQTDGVVKQDKVYYSHVSSSVRLHYDTMVL